MRHRRELLIAAKTKGLISTPTAEETSLGLKQTIDFTLAPFGGGSAKLTLETFVRSTLGETPFTASVTICKAGEGPVTVTTEVSDLRRPRRAQMWVSDDAQKLYRGRLLQLLGFNEAASAAYKEISGHDAEWAVLKKHFTTLPVSQNRL